MITEKTVFILGAGASAPYGYPTGEELRRIICFDYPKIANQDIYFDREDNGNQDKRDTAKKAKKLAEVFYKSSASSIDLFLSANRDYSEIGKRAIICSIHRAEMLSKFREEISDPKNDWYTYLYRRMTKILTEPDSYKGFGNNKVSFITFNYDRSLEYFLYESLTNFFTTIPLQKIKTAKLIPFPFLHVYGKIANLPWQTANGIEYKKKEIGSVIDKMINNIRIIYDKTANENDINTMKGTIQNAKRIFFLGFGYAKENLDILDLPNILRKGQKIYGTAYGWTNKEIEDLKMYLTDESLLFEVISMEDIVIRDTDCVGLLREFL